MISITDVTLAGARTVNYQNKHWLDAEKHWDAVTAHADTQYAQWVDGQKVRRFVLEDKTTT